MPDDFASQMANPPRLSEKEQKEAGRAIEGQMEQEHHEFLDHIAQMVERGEIDALRPDSILNHQVYDKLRPELKAKVDLAKINIIQQLHRIYAFYKSRATPDSSPHLLTMIEHLWHMKQRIEEEKPDVFKF